MCCLQYESVQEVARKQAIHSRIALTNDLRNRNRLMPPPLNMVVVILSVVVDIINFFVALIYPRLNIYRLISAELFFNLQNMDVFRPCLGDSKWQPIKGSESLFETRTDVLRWYFVAPFYRFGFLRKIICCISDKMHDQDKKPPSWNYFHKSCYGVLLLEGNPNDALSERVKGITMTTYCDRYCRKRYV